MGLTVDWVGRTQAEHGVSPHEGRKATIEVVGVTVDDFHVCVRG